MSSPSPHKSPEILGSPSASSSSRSQFTFSRHATTQRPGIGSPRMSRQGSTTSLTSSIGGFIDTSVQSSISPINELSQNAISNLLQPPLIRTGVLAQQPFQASSAHKQPSTRDIPPVTLANIRHVEPSAFQPYLSQVGSLFSAYQRAKQESEEAAPQLFRRDTETNDSVSSFLGGKSRRDSASSVASSKHEALVMSPLEIQETRSFSPAIGAKRRQYAPSRLSTIPDVYFEENFHLENPRIFDIVSERAEVVPQTPGAIGEDNDVSDRSTRKPSGTRKALHTNAILQEKLSWYMDTVEVHLISSTAIASASFFAALGSLKELHSEATESIIKIRTLRSALKTLDLEMAEGGLRVIQMRRRRENLRKLRRAADQVCEVMKQRSHCEELVDDGQLEDADAAIESLEDLVAGKSTGEEGDVGRIDLRQLKALDALPDVIFQLRNRIGKGYEIRFIEALLADLRQHVKSVPRRETLQRWANSSLRTRGEHNRTQSLVPAYLKTNERLRPDLLSALGGLNKSGHTGRAATAYREAILREIRSLIRENLPSSSDDDTESITSISTRGGRKLTQQEKSSILARNLRALDAETAEELLANIYTSVGEALRRLGMHVKLMLDVTSNINQPMDAQKPMSPGRGPQSKVIETRVSNYVQDDVYQALDLSTLLVQAVDSVQTQVSKILKVRSEQAAALPLNFFLRYFTLNRLFADECEAVSGRSGDAVKGAVNTQIGDFLKHMAESEIQTVTKALEMDRWEAKDFGIADSAVLNRILDGMTRTPPAWTTFTQMWEASVNGALDINGGNALQEKTRNAVIDEQKYVLVASASILLNSIDRFENLIAGIPSLATDASAKLLELLKLFNSRCVQLILGSGARQTAGLKSITTKHLALASQTISFVAAIIPYIREFVRRQSPAAGAILPEFDNVKRLFQDHQVGIHEKLVEIMSGRSNVHVNAMKQIDWDIVSDAAHSGSVSPYMETLTKETATLHKVLTRHMSDMDIMMIMTPIFASYSKDWTQAFQTAVVKTEAGKARMLRDVEYLDTKFSKMEASGDLGSNLITVVKEKRVERAPSPIRAPSPEALFDAETATPVEEIDEPKMDEAVDDATHSSEPQPSVETTQPHSDQKANEPINTVQPSETTMTPTDENTDTGSTSALELNAEPVPKFIPNHGEGDDTRDENAVKPVTRSSENISENTTDIAVDTLKDTVPNTGSESHQDEPPPSDPKVIEDGDPKSIERVDDTPTSSERNEEEAENQTSTD